MDRIVQGIVWALFALLAYNIAGGIFSHWVTLPGFGDLLFVPIFVLFSLIHASRMLGWRRAVLFLALTFTISFIVEETGVRTGLIFGRYHYGDMLGPKISNVPVLIPLGWFMMVYPCWVVSNALLRGLDLRRPAGMVALALFAALAITGWDMVMDPPMAAAGNWIWEDGGPYFGVPILNFFGWWANTFVIYLVFDLVDRALSRERSRSYRFGTLFAALPVILYAWFSLQYLSPDRRAPLILIAIFSMVTPGLLALVRLALPQTNKA